MKKIIFLIFAVTGLAGSYFFHDNLSGAISPTTESTVVEKTVDPTVTPTPTLTPAEPITMSIPSINVTADVEHVAKDSEGRMDVPKNVFNTAWYELGASPGEKGNAVIAGHLDTPTGEPSIFSQIGTLQPGDEIITTDERGTEFIFEVVDVATYDNSRFPLETVFGSNDKAMLNLITCAGVFDPTASDYSQRTVVFSELSEVEDG